MCEQESLFVFVNRGDSKQLVRENERLSNELIEAQSHCFR